MSKTSGLAKEGETRFCNGPVARRGGWLVQRVRHERSVTIDVGRYHGQQIDRSDDEQEEHSDAADDRWPDRSN
jgi:hypothetical protein